MAATPSYKKEISVATTVSGTYECLGNSGSLEASNDVLDDTRFCTNAGYRNKIYGLTDWSVSIEDFFVDSDAAQTILRDAFFNKTVIYVKYLPDAASPGIGLKGPVLVESISQSGGVGDIESISYSLSGTGALVADNT